MEDFPGPADKLLAAEQVACRGSLQAMLAETCYSPGLGRNRAREKPITQKFIVVYYIAR
jgi:hypothetical protein